MFIRLAALLLAVPIAGCDAQALGKSNRTSIERDAASIFREDFRPSPKKVPCPTNGKIMVAVIVGQSNVANHAGDLTKAGPQVVNFYKGACYEAADPMLGATGQTGSVWPQFGDNIIASGRYDAVVLAPAAVGASHVESWAPGGVLSARTELRLAELKAANYIPTHILVQLGESEGHEKSDPATFRADATRLLSSLRATGAKVVFATTSRCMDDPNAEIRSAQVAARRAAGAVAGPDADVVPDNHRINICHYDGWAQRYMAAAWARSAL